jgi:hypothetical protein
LQPRVHGNAITNGSIWQARVPADLSTVPLPVRRKKNALPRVGVLGARRSGYFRLFPFFASKGYGKTEKTPLKKEHEGCYVRVENKLWILVPTQSVGTSAKLFTRVFGKSAYPKSRIRRSSLLSMSRSSRQGNRESFAHRLPEVSDPRLRERETVHGHQTAFLRRQEKIARHSVPAVNKAMEPGSGTGVRRNALTTPL